MMQRMRMTLDGYLRRLPLVVSVLLALAIGWQITGLVIRWLNPVEEVPAPPPVQVPAAPPAPSLADRRAAIEAAALFGVDAGASGPVPSTLGWTLVGVIAETDPLAGRAILGENAAGARVYAVGDGLPGGRRLHSVYPDRIWLEYSGKLEELLMPRLKPLGGGPTPSSASANPAGGPGIGGQWTDLLRWQAVIRPDKPSGLRIYPGPNARLFSQAGLVPGDLLLAINDTPLEDPANAEQFLRTLTGTPQVKLTVERGGRRENILIDLAALQLAGPT